MKRKNFLIKGETTKHRVIVNDPVHLSDTSYDEMYDGFSERWEEKARRLQARRWRKIKHQLV